MFLNREDAGRQLAAELLRFKNEQPCVLALPRGGVPVAFEVAKALNAPLDLVIVRKIGAPNQPELAIGAIVDGEHPELVVNQRIVDILDISEEYLQEERARQIREIERRRQVYLGDRPRVDVAGHTALIVDDGIATGATIRAALRATRRARPKRLILAVPVAPSDTVSELRDEADEVVCLETHDAFGAISLYYEDFAQVSDDEVRDLLGRAAQFSPTPSIGQKTDTKTA
jgi:putative phosphoribosyl transferase